MLNPVRNKWMRRFVLRSLGTLSVVVGSWAGVNYVREKIAAEPALEEPAPLPVAATGPMPKPIPLADADSPPVADPFSARNTSWGSRRGEYNAAPAAEPPADADRYGRPLRSAATAADDDIPAAQDALGNGATSRRPTHGSYRLRSEVESPQAPDAAALQTSGPAPRSVDPYDAAGRAVQPAAAVPIERSPIEPHPAATPPAPFPMPTQGPNAPRPIPIAPPLPAPTQAQAADDALNNFAPPQPAAFAGGVQQTAGQAPLGAEQAPSQPSAQNNFAGTEPLTSISEPAPLHVASAQGTGRPGAPQLEGPQAPTVTIEKTAPAEIQVGKPAVFVIRVRNTGSVAAQAVQIHDELPQGTQLVSTTPTASRGPQGGLVFDLGTLKPGQEATAELQLLPLVEGEIGSKATVHFGAEASVRTMATKPDLVLELTGPDRVMIGTPVTLHIKVANPGTGAATGVVLFEKLPTGLKHPAGEELEFEIGTLKPGEARELELVLTAAAAGQVVNLLSARGDANLKTETKCEFEIIAPALEVGLSGAKRRVLERNATYTITVANPGTAPTQDVELATILPAGLKFVSANNAGQYDAASHSVYWSLEELPPQETGNVTLVAMPVESGEMKIQIKGQARQNLADEHDATIYVDGVSAIQFELVDVTDPVEVGGETAYEVRVTNSGSKAATNLRLVALLPAGMKALSAEAPVRYVVDGTRVLFDPLKQLAPKADTTYTIKAQALQAGDLRLRVQVVTDEIQTPITKEESTRAYADE